MNRTCGTCNACCVHIEIPVLDKPAGKPCQHLCNAAAGCCSIYERRPAECATYTCAWLDGCLPDDFRPDRSGILLDKCRIEGERPLTILIGSEIKAGSIDRHGAEIAASIPTGSVAFVTPFDADGEPGLFSGSEADHDVFIEFIEKTRRDGAIIHKFADGTFVQEIGSRELVKIEPAPTGKPN